MPYYISPPPMNPISRILAAILALLALAGALFFGVFVLAFAVGTGLVAWLVLTVRLWWLRKKGGPTGVTPDQVFGQGRRPGTVSGDERRDIIDAEYTVVEKQDEES